MNFRSRIWNLNMNRQLQRFGQRHVPCQASRHYTRRLCQRCCSRGQVPFLGVMCSTRPCGQACKGPSSKLVRVYQGVSIEACVRQRLHSEVKRAKMGMRQRFAVMMGVCSMVREASTHAGSPSQGQGAYAAMPSTQPSVNQCHCAKMRHFLYFLDF